MQKTDELTMRELHLMGAAKQLANLMHQWNVIDERDLVIDNSRTETPYHHVTSALGKILVLLDVTNPDHKMSFYDMVTTGMSPAEAITRIRELDVEAEQ